VLKEEGFLVSDGDEGFGMNCQLLGVAGEDFMDCSFESRI
jgi:hypothetical protein